MRVLSNLITTAACTLLASAGLGCAETHVSLDTSSQSVGNTSDALVTGKRNSFVLRPDLRPCGDAVLERCGGFFARPLGGGEADEVYVDGADVEVTGADPLAGSLGDTLSSYEESIVIGSLHRCGIVIGSLTKDHGEGREHGIVIGSRAGIVIGSRGRVIGSVFEDSAGDYVVVRVDPAGTPNTRRGR